MILHLAAVHRAARGQAIASMARQLQAAAHQARQQAEANQQDSTACQLSKRQKRQMPLQLSTAQFASGMWRGAEVSDHVLQSGTSSGSDLGSPSTSESAHSASTTEEHTRAAPKSAKRKAAEALLAARFSSSSSAASAVVSNGLGSNKRPRSSAITAAAAGGVALQGSAALHSYCSFAAAGAAAPAAPAAAAVTEAAATAAVTETPAHSSGWAILEGARTASQRAASVAVAACAPSCAHSKAHGWCHMEVRVPHVDWCAVLDADLAQVPHTRLASGYEQLQLPQGLKVLVVENALYLPDALQKLRDSMTDRVLAIDLEWRPEFGGRFTPVAMLQLSSARLALLVRTCRMHHCIPPALKEFLADPKHTLLGFSWANSDEAKMKSTFGFGSAHFSSFHDLQAAASGLGYGLVGLGRLTQLVLGLHLPKSKKVTMSNWEARVLSKAQLKYAALDVLVCGQVFRGLRLWHSSPSPCAECLQPLGVAPGAAAGGDVEGGGSDSGGLGAFVCGEAGCGRHFSEGQRLLAHCRAAGHKAHVAECQACGRLVPSQAAPPDAEAAAAVIAE